MNRWRRVRPSKTERNRGGALKGDVGSRKSDPSPESARPRLVPIALAVLACAGLLVSFYLTLSHYRNVIPPCYVTKGCEKVVTSPYSVVAGIPISLAGVLFFALVFYLSIALATVRSRLVVLAYRTAVSLGVLVALGLFLLQALQLRAYCSYCLTTEIIAFLLWAASLLPHVSRNAPRGFAQGTANQP